MGKVFVSKNMQKESIVIDKHGNVVSRTFSNNRADEMKRKQEERARRLGLR